MTSTDPSRTRVGVIRRALAAWRESAPSTDTESPRHRRERLAWELARDSRSNAAAIRARHSLKGIRP